MKSPGFPESRAPFGLHLERVRYLGGDDSGGVGFGIGLAPALLVNFVTQRAFGGQANLDYRGASGDLRPSKTGNSGML